MPRWRRWRPRPAPACCCWPTTGATRPRPSSCRRCAAAPRPACRRCRGRSPCAGLVWARPWLDQPRRAIDAYVQRHRLQPVDDPSNADDRLARNRLRLQLWPALEAAFPHAETSLAAAAVRAQEARAALDELAALDLAPLVDADGALAVAGWRALSAGTPGQCAARLVGGAGRPQRATGAGVPPAGRSARQGRGALARRCRLVVHAARRPIAGGRPGLAVQAKIMGCAPGPRHA
jgi:hypothetical protein